MTEHFTQAGMKGLVADIGISFYPRCFSDKNLTDLCNAAVNHKLKEWGAQKPVGYILPTTGKFVHASTIAAGHAGAHWEKLFAAPVAPAQPRNGALFDSQWVNIVNAPEVLNAPDKEEAVAAAIRLAEKAFRENITLFALANAKAAPAQGHGQIVKIIGIGPEYRPDEHDRGVWLEEDGVCVEYADGYRDCFYVSELTAAAPQQEQKGGE